MLYEKVIDIFKATTAINVWILEYLNSDVSEATSWKALEDLIKSLEKVLKDFKKYQG